MSDTPESDRAMFDCQPGNPMIKDGSWVVRVQEMRRMERERDEARALVKKAVTNLGHNRVCPGAFRPQDCKCGYMGLLYEVEGWEKL